VGAVEPVADMSHRHNQRRANDDLDTTPAATDPELRLVTQPVPAARSTTLLSASDVTFSSTSVSSLIEMM
jgi:hypothetical protein